MFKYGKPGLKNLSVRPYKALDTVYCRVLLEKYNTAERDMKYAETSAMTYVLVDETENAGFFTLRLGEPCTLQHFALSKAGYQMFKASWRALIRVLVFLGVQEFVTTVKKTDTRICSLLEKSCGGVLLEATGAVKYYNLKTGV